MPEITPPLPPVKEYPPPSPLDVPLLAMNEYPDPLLLEVPRTGLESIIYFGIGPVTVLPPKVKSALGVELPIPTLPFARTVKSDVPVEDATLNGFCVPLPCILYVTVEDVALIPETVPLSIEIPDPSVVEVSQRERYPEVPPVRDGASPREDVATHWVLVPVVWRTIPRVPEALVESKNPPVRPKSPDTVSVRDGVDDPMPTLPLDKIEKRLRPVDDAIENGLRPARDWMNTDDERVVVPEESPPKKEVPPW